MTLAIFIIITVLITTYSLAPLWHPKGRWLVDDVHGEDRRALEAEKESYLWAMKDIEFEHASNKINNQDYARLKKHYGAKAAKTISDIEKLVTPKMLAFEVNPGEKIEQDGKRELELGALSVIEKIDMLESAWRKGAVNSEQYFIQHDEYKIELKKLLKKSE
jgi:hypothetical protein